MMPAKQGATRRKPVATPEPFVDARAMAQKHPDTFSVPSDAEIAAIRHGDCVKVSRNGERFWVVVMGWDDYDYQMTGKVANHLMDPSNADFPLGHTVKVEPRHVYAIRAEGMSKHAGSPLENMRPVMVTDNADEPEHDPLTCDECGKDLTAEEEFDWRDDLIIEALEGIGDPGMELALIAFAAGRFLASAPADMRKKVRRELIKEIDDATRECVVAACDA